MRFIPKYIKISRTTPKTNILWYYLFLKYIKKISRTTPKINILWYFSFLLRGQQQEKEGGFLSVFFTRHTLFHVFRIYSADPSPSVTSGSAANIEIANILSGLARRLPLFLYPRIYYYILYINVYFSLLCLCAGYSYPWKKKWKNLCETTATTKKPHLVENRSWCNIQVRHETREL